MSTVRPAAWASMAVSTTRSNSPGHCRPAFAGAPHGPLLDRYDRRRRPVARDEIMAQADRNRARMRERDAGRRRAMLAGLQAVAGDPAKLRAHLLQTSMIDGLRRAAAIQ